MRRTRFAWLVGLLASLSAAPARADPLEGIGVRWRAPPDCPEASLRADAAGLLPADRKYEPMEIEIAVDATADGVRIAMHAQSASRSAERAMTLPSCDEARKAAALLVALALDPEVAGAIEPKSEPEPEVAPAASPVPTPVQPAAQRPTSAPPVSGPNPTEAKPSSVPALEVSLLAVLEPALLPEPSPGGSAEIGVRMGRIALSATGLYLLGRDAAVLDHPTARAGAQLWTAGLALCAFQPLGRAGEIGPCLAGELGDYSAKAEGVERGRQDSALFAAIRIAALYALPISPHVALLAGVGVLVPVQRPVMEFRDLGRVHSVPSWSIRGSLGVRFDTAGG